MTAHLVYLGMTRCFSKILLCRRCQLPRVSPPSPPNHGRLGGRRFDLLSKAENIILHRNFTLFTRKRACIFLSWIPKPIWIDMDQKIRATGKLPFPKIEWKDTSKTVSKIQLYCNTVDSFSLLSSSRLVACRSQRSPRALSNSFPSPRFRLSTLSPVSTWIY